ncbi:SDR family oxidoreductase [Paenibacillus sp. chi10]|uniref:SDR family oxidoreductase n=1 Tax=Paenibacillus suaedae TaxID=3077233 RepID=A0AAJ2JU34_9BACL|nr:SDR family oxidoreductase [Paenibacillus sp. chi10]MDT8977088.1 SDR family oxidoreductase [Paenibacillus sp. chi10]
MSGVYQYVIEKTASGSIDKAIGVEILKHLKREDKGRSRQDIAIIGMAVEMPNAEDLSQFWSNLRNGIDCVAPFPDSRKADLHEIRQAGQLGDDPKYAEGAYLRDVAHFDPAYFKISPMEAKLMDPQQRLFLQNAWKAMADAGYGGNRLSKSRTGVYVGLSGDFNDSYQELIAAINPDQLPLSVTGNIASIIASRISYCLNLRGPAMLVDTACSSSLVAVHLAALGLRNGDCEVAIAGGVKVNLLPLKERMHPLGIASSTGRTRTFDDGSDGTGFGEGVAAIVLKPLEQACKDGDRIYAVIKGSAVNQDGSSSGISAPNALAQEDVLIRAWEDAGIEPETISYMEAHGTGTKLGDPIEIDGIAKAFAHFTTQKQFCAVGSVKSNIGHLDHLAGLAGLVKSVLALQHGEIPPSLHFQRPNGNIPFESSPVFVNDKLIPWIAEDTPRRCGVSSFGLSGTNCHMVLEEAPSFKEEADAANTGRPRVLMLSANTKEALRELVQSYRFHLERKACWNLDDLCYTANTGRGQYSHRLALLFTDEVELKAKISRLARSEEWSILEEENVYYGENRIVSSQKTNRQAGELTEESKRRLTAQARSLLVAGGQLAELARLYVGGADVEWTTLYRDRKYSKTELPPDPFTQKRFWVEAAANKQRIEPTIHGNAQPLTSLIDRQLADTMSLRIYASEFRFEERWVLSEHRIGDNGIVPGTTYLDMIRQLSLLHYPGKESHLEQVTFLSPLYVSEGEARQMHLFLEEEGEDRLRFTVISRDEDEHVWVKHCEGRLLPAVPRNDRSFSHQEVLDRFAECEPIEVQEQYQGEIQFGPRWHNVKQIRVDRMGVLARIALPDAFASDGREHQLHPALMDNAMNIAISHIGEGFYLPWMYKKLRVYERMPKQFFSLISLKQEIRQDAETAVFDVTLFDEEGRVIAEAEDYVIKRVNKQGVVYQGLKPADSFRMTWVPEPAAPVEPAVKPHGSVLLLSNDRQTAASFSERFAQAGCNVIEIELGGQFRKVGPDRFTVSADVHDFTLVLQATDTEQIGQIVYLMQEPPKGDEDYERFDDLRKKSVEGLFSLIQSLLHNKVSQPLDFMLMAPNAQSISGEESGLQPMFSALFGLGKVIREEYPTLRVRCIDYDEMTPFDTLWKEIAAQPSVYCIGYRQGVRYLPQLVPLEQDQTIERPLELKTDGVYLLTGGLGGVGLELGKHFAASLPGINLAFLNRTPLPPREQWANLTDDSGNGRTERAIQALLEMERRGATVWSYSADVSNPDDLERVLRELRAEHGRINGIVHAAGVAGKGYLFSKDPKDFRTVLAPKVGGTWLLDKLTEEDNPDFFVLFSSVASLMGGIGQGDYAAANAYLDAFAADRSRRGKRTLAINWPAWKETGMAVDHGVQDNGVLQAIRTSSALQALDHFLMQEHVQVIVGKLNDSAASVLSNSFLFGLAPELERKIARMNAARERRMQKDEPVVFAEVELQGKTAYSETEIKLAQIWAGVMELEQINVYDSFYSLGGDSIIAVRIVSNMADHLDVEIGVNELLDHATIEALASHLDNLAGRNPEIRHASSEQILTKSGGTGQVLEDHGTTADAVAELPDKAIISLSSFERVQELSWRQLNCYDRGFAIQFGDENAYWISYFKLFLGLKRGYDLSAQGYPYALSDQEEIFGYATDHQILGKFGFAIRQLQVEDASQLHETICRLVEQKKPVMVAFDEFYTFYTPFYLKEHTDHLTVIHGYDRRNKTYSIVNHNHLQIQARHEVSYGHFTTPFALLEEIYGDLPAQSRTVITLERIPEAVVNVNALRKELLHLLRQLMEDDQAGSDIELIANWESHSEESLKQKMRELYIMLGGKELFVDALVRDFIEEPQKTAVREAADVIVNRSSQLVTKFITGIFRKRGVTSEELELERTHIRQKTREFLDLAVKALERIPDRQES